MKENERMKRYIECVCGCSIIRMEYDFEDGYIFVSIYRQGTNLLIHRLRQMWQVFCHGHAYGDEVVLDMENAKILANFIKLAMVKK